jgi:hypothetical protein
MNKDKNLVILSVKHHHHNTFEIIILYFNIYNLD